MEKRLGIRDYLRVLVKWRRLIFWDVFLITSAAIAISLIIQEKYTSRASLLPPLPGTEFLGTEAGGASSGLSALRGAFGISTPSDLFAKILSSERVKDGVIKDCNLKEVYKTKTKRTTYDKLDDATDIAVTPEGIITISTTDESPLLAKELAESYVKNLDEVNKNLVMSIGKRNRIFLEHRLEEVKAELKKFEEALRGFQEAHRTISIEEEIVPLLHSISDLRANILANEVKLGVLQKYATNENPEVINLKYELDELHKKLQAMEYTGDDSHFGVGFSIPFKKVPKVQLELARLTRDVIVQEKLFELLMEQYERAKLQEARDTPTVNVLEDAKVPEHKSYPRRRIIVMGAFVISFAFGVLLAFFLNWAEELPPDEKRKWQEIWNMWRRKHA